jgi:hypothetical protein
MADANEFTLSTNTHAALQGLVRASHDLVAWEHNLRSALDDDVMSGRLTPQQAEHVARDAKLKDFKAPNPDHPKAAETTAEGNQAQLDAQTKTNAAEAAKTAAPAHHPNQERENRERAEHERRVEHEQREKAEREQHEKGVRELHEREEKAKPRNATPRN